MFDYRLDISSGIGTRKKTAANHSKWMEFNEHMLIIVGVEKQFLLLLPLLLLFLLF